MIKPKMKSGSQILTMIQRVHKEYEKCKADKERKGPIHPDTTLLLGMVTFGTWVISDIMDKEIMEKLNSLFDEGPIEKNLLKSKKGYRSITEVKEITPPSTQKPFPLTEL